MHFEFHQPLQRSDDRSWATPLYQVYDTRKSNFKAKRRGVDCATPVTARLTVLEQDGWILPGPECATHAFATHLQSGTNRSQFFNRRKAEKNGRFPCGPHNGYPGVDEAPALPSDIGTFFLRFPVRAPGPCSVGK